MHRSARPPGHATSGHLTDDGATSRGVQVRGTTGFTAQGGTSTGCGVPAGATSVALSVTATGAAKGGFLVGYPGDTAKPFANFAWFWKDRTSTSNPTLALSKNGTSDLRLYASATTQVIVDVAGYHEPQIEALVNGSAAAGFFSATSRVLGVTSSGVGGVHGVHRHQRRLLRHVRHADRQ